MSVCVCVCGGGGGLGGCYVQQEEQVPWQRERTDLLHPSLPIVESVCCWPLMAGEAENP